jgi:hypothetical protein
MPFAVPVTGYGPGVVGMKIALTFTVEFGATVERGPNVNGSPVGAVRVTGAAMLPLFVIDSGSVEVVFSEVELNVMLAGATERMTPAQLSFSATV